MNKQQWFTGSFFCIINIAETPFETEWFRFCQEIFGNGRKLDCFVDSSGGDSSAGRKNKERE